MLRDRVGIVLMFLMPIALVLIVTSIQNGTFQLMTKSKINILVCNRDTGALSNQFIQAIGQIGMFKQFKVDGTESDAQVRDRMNTKDALLAVIIPPDFTGSIRARAKNVTGKALNSFGLQGDTVKSRGNGQSLILYFQPVIQDAYRLSVNGGLRTAQQIVESRETLRQLYMAINDKPMPAKLEDELLRNSSQIREIPVIKNGVQGIPNATQHNIPAWTVFAMFFIIISLGGSVVREKVSGSFIRLKTLPTSFVIALLSKQITYLTVTLLQALVIFAIGIWIFPLINLPILHLPADLLALLVVTLVCGWCAVSYAICIGIFAQTHDQVSAFGAVSIVILAAIGGLMVPSFAMPGGFQTAANFSPLHWCLEAYYGLFLEGGHLADVLSNIVPLLIITFLIQALTFWGLKKQHII